MKITIKNIGPVKNATVDLSKNLIVVCGPNNTGKTYFEYAIYGVIQRIFSGITAYTIVLKKNADELIATNVTTIDSNDLLEEYFNKYFETVITGINNSINDIFGVTGDFFTDSKIEIDFSTLKEEVKKYYFEREMNFTSEINQNSKYNLITSKKQNDTTITVTLNIINPDEEIKPASVTTSLFIEVLASAFVAIKPSRAFIAAIERVAINVFSKEIATNRFDIVDKALKKNKSDLSENASTYPLPINDALKDSINLANIKSNIGPFANLADELEKEILHGEIKVSDEGEVQFKPDSVDNLLLPIRFSASIIKSLSNLVIYLRHSAQYGDLIIIDEPELSLHPDNQIFIARLIAKLSNSGFKVLISTHSMVIIKELNNLIQLNKINNIKFAENLGYHPEHILDKNKMQIILFDGDEVKELEIGEKGFSISSIDKVMDSLKTVDAQIKQELHSQQ